MKVLGEKDSEVKLGLTADQGLCRALLLKFKYCNRVPLIIQKISTCYFSSKCLPFKVIKILFITLYNVGQCNVHSDALFSKNLLEGCSFFHRVLSTAWPQVLGLPGSGATPTTPLPLDK